MFASNYYTLPSYQRLRDIYPGYGRQMMDSTDALVIQGSTFRKGAKDLSIRSVQSAYDDQNLFLSISVKSSPFDPSIRSLGLQRRVASISNYATDKLLLVCIYQSYRWG